MNREKKNQLPRIMKGPVPEDELEHFCRRSEVVNILQPKSWKAQRVP